MTNYFKGTLRMNYHKIFDSQFEPGVQNHSLQIIIPQYVGKGKGFNGSDYNGAFFNLQISSKSLFGKMLIDGQKVLVVGEIRQKQTKDNGQATYIQATRIYTLGDLPQDNGANTGTSSSNDYAMKDSTFDDSILWED